jgi:hypothetical protein
MAVQRPGKGKAAPQAAGKGSAKSSTKGATAAPAEGGGGMKIHIPEGLGGGDLKIMEGSTKATLDKIAWGLSQTKQPKATFMYTVLDELSTDDNQPTTVGERVLETFSLQPQALFRLNDVYKEATGEGLPVGDYSEEEFHSLIEEALQDTEWQLNLQKGMDQNGKERTEVGSRAFLGK